MHKQCRLCNARCCRYFCFPIDTPCTREDFDQVRWYLVHEHVQVHIDPAGDWWMFVENRCRWLEETNAGPRCANYGRRPLICRGFSPRTCDFTMGPYATQRQFDTADELEAYACELLGEPKRVKTTGRKTGKKSLRSGKPNE
jgi:Fe-S-cluster containining protein